MPDEFGLKDLNLFSKLKRVGVVKLPLLSAEKIDQIQAFIRQELGDWESKYADQFYLSVLEKDTKLKRKLHTQVLEFIGPELDANFENYRCIVALILIKSKGPNSEVDFHQDLSVCDESKHQSYTLWIPLTPSTKENGAIRFLKCSHKIFRHVRSQTIPAPFDDMKEDLKKFMSFYPAQSGEALLWDQACIHQSPPNQESKPRLALGLTLIGKDTPLEMYRYNEANRNLEVYSVPDDFWFRYEDFVAEKKEVPKFGKRTGEIENFSFQNLTKKDVYFKYLTKRFKQQFLP